MRNKQECEMVKDLLPNYIENLLSEQTKRYVEAHIVDCLECSKLFNEIKENRIIENEECLNAEQSKIKLLKKHRSKKIMLKIICISLISTLIIILGIFSIKIIPNYCIISRAYSSFNELKDMSNYKVTIEEIHIDNETEKKEVFITTYYYKDGKFKEENDKTKMTYYGDENSNITVYINNNGEKCEIKTKGNIFERYSGDIIAYNRNIIAKLGIVNIDVEENKYNGKECFVLVINEEKEHYREIWIDKETMTQVREIQEILTFSHYYERNIKIEKNVVTDEDITINES